MVGFFVYILFRPSDAYSVSERERDTIIEDIPAYVPQVVATASPAVLVAPVVPIATITPTARATFDRPSAIATLTALAPVPTFTVTPYYIEPQAIQWYGAPQDCPALYICVPPSN